MWGGVSGGLWTNKIVAGLWSTVVRVFGEPPHYRNNVFGIVQFKHHYPSYQKTPLLAYGVQWYGWLERRPYGTQGTQGGGTGAGHTYTESAQRGTRGGIVRQHS